jgi:hypothetical protein
VIDAAALRDNVASFAVCRMLAKLVKIIVPINPTTKHRAKNAATPLRTQSRYFFEAELAATAAGKVGPGSIAFGGATASPAFSSLDWLFRSPDSTANLLGSANF